MRAPQRAPSLKVSTPGDAHERAADRVAGEMTRQPELQCGCGGLCAPCAGKKLLPSGGDPPGSRGRPLDDAARTFFEPRFGYDLRSIRVHTDAESAASARALGATAFTVGSDIAFDCGRYAPETSDGRALLAHELTHVIQQASSGPLIHRQVNPNAAADAEAIAFNQQVLRGAGERTVGVLRGLVGLPASPPVIDADLANAVQRWQGQHGLTQDGKIGPQTAAAMFRQLGRRGQARCRIRTGPRYMPRGRVPVVDSGPNKTARFTLSADFENMPSQGIFPSCCEVRQEMQWDQAAASSAGGVPHAGWPASTAVGQWNEDRDPQGARYGHRSGPHARPTDYDQYLDGSGRRNQAFGSRYRGSDDPLVPARQAGNWRFRLTVIDVCRGRRLGAADRTDVPWGPPR